MIKVLRETHDTPESVTQLLRLAGGVNRFGEPLYRAVWGWNRLTLMGGCWEQKNEDGSPEQFAYRWVPKYPQLNRWHIEKWLPPESYGSPLAWWNTEKERELGPYPVRGEYEHCFTLAGPAGEFLQLTPTVAEHIALAIERSRAIERSKNKRAIEKREEKQDQDYDSWAYDMLDDAVPAFHQQPFVSVL